MAIRQGSRWSVLSLMAACALAACGEAQSAGQEVSLGQDPGSEEPAPGAPLEELPAAEQPAPVLEPSAEPVSEPAAEAPAADPAPARPAARREPAPAPEPQPEPEVVVEPEPEPVSEPRPEPAARAVPAGSTLELTLETPLSTERNKVGDTFWATVAEDVLGEQSEVLVPLGARVRGRVVESRESPGPDQPAVLRLEVESVTLDGAVRPLSATVVDVAVEADARDSGGRTAVKVGVGAAAGAALGRILGKDRGATVAGAVAGAAAGTAVAMATRDGQATIAEGARLVIRLDEQLVLQR